MRLVLQGSADGRGVEHKSRVYRFEFESTTGIGIDGRVCSLRMIVFGGAVRVAALSGSRLLAWHNVGDDGAVRDGFFRFFS